MMDVHYNKTCSVFIFIRIISVLKLFLTAIEIVMREMLNLRMIAISKISDITLEI